ncbi:O-antigen polymerase [Clostridium sp. 'White wine YQ']|uniref:O-antigen polymerase n=1 Tax=Clostridium sp. 'White wine YQ' TaxID=3027474 RepID=UPI0023658060|nr:O-antigen polymerase [Clostridium sp. 'White wine YQ']MDD7792752.1 O-antigen ligase [Clostridium sp. 'White wine YQ']
MINPFFVYLVSFVGVLLTYLLGWSNLYPNLSLSLIVFLIVTFLSSGFLGRYYYKINGTEFNLISYKKKYMYGVYFIIIGFLLEFIYTKGMPLTNSSIIYADYKGIPTIHVILYTFTIFYSIFLFYLFICTRKKILIGGFIVTLIPSFLLISRGMLLNIFIGCFFVGLQYIVSKKLINKKVILGISSSILVVFFIFGLFGNYRNNKQISSVENKFSSDYILSIGEASNGFRNSIIPKPFFWAYLYISSPLANLQKNIDEYNPNINNVNFKKFITVEIIPDFISKRISSTYVKDSSKKVKLIKPNLVVGTVFMGAYYYLGWVGIILIYLYMAIFIFIYLKLIKENKTYYVVGIASLCNIIALNTFSNMLSYSGMLFQLVYPLAFFYFSKFIKIIKKNEYLNKKFKKLKRI